MIIILMREILKIYFISHDVLYWLQISKFSPHIADIHACMAAEDDYLTIPDALVEKKMAFWDWEDWSQGTW